MIDLPSKIPMASEIAFAPRTPTLTMNKSPKRFLYKVTTHEAIMKDVKKIQVKNLKPCQKLKVNSESKSNFKRPTSSLLARIPKERK